MYLLLNVFMAAFAHPPKGTKSEKFGYCVPPYHKSDYSEAYLQAVTAPKINFQV